MRKEGEGRGGEVLVDSHAAGTDNQHTGKLRPRLKGLSPMTQPPSLEDPSLEDLVRGFCLRFNLDPDKVRPSHVLLILEDGRRFRASEAPPADILHLGLVLKRILIQHPDSQGEPIEVEIMPPAPKRQH